MLTNPNIGVEQRSPADQELFARAYDLPRTLLPMAAQIAACDPEFILACDRNARPLGFALEKIYESRGEPIPTIDGKIHYRKVTSKVAPRMLQAHLQPLFEDMAQQKGDRPHRLVVIDDHVRNGDTMHAFRKATAAAHVGLRTTWMTVTGRGADYAVHPYVGPYVLMPWRDRAGVLGIDYTPDLVAQDTATELSYHFYATVAAGAAALGAVPDTMK